MTLRLFAVGALLFLGLSPSYAQDVCCIMGRKTEGGGTETRGQAMASADCRTGATIAELRVCASSPDASNLCSTLSEEARCKQCGYFWNGTVCLSEDPVAKAKQEIEAKLKKESEEKLKGDGKKSPAPESDKK